jgi:hypothetical protein
VGVSFAQEVVRSRFVRPSAPVASHGVTGEGTHVGYVSKLVTFTTLSENGGVPEADELATFAKHPDTFLCCLFGNFTRVVHVCEHHRCVFPEVMGGTRIVGHLRDWDVSENRITSHFFYQSVGTGDVLLMVGGPDMSELGPHPVAGRDDGADFEMFQ